MEIKSTNNMEWVGIGFICGGALLGVGLGISAILLKGHLGWSPSVFSVLAVAGTSMVLGGVIGYAILCRSKHLEEKDRKVFNQFRTLCSNGENL